ncbi:ABC transporter permease [Goodfellowiella coeruleoviolacea]|uniref:Oligopeptide transport system permease protein OppC n=1 Tax=Goodfellowiella coeruleoviolacea TaxID=334858 RepID=A0AAE3GBZ8_9PSEU|nr:ABC transporter permease [Goodfellowiella coeruleoviolacea]MCP2164294.1 peptide/nickel transport system permease protein [Goodfellowiella coeruleoviolacea]
MNRMAADTANTPGGPDAPATATAGAVRLGAAAGATRGRLTLRRFLRNRLAVAGVVVIVLLYVLAFAAPLFSPWDFTSQDPDAYLSPPSARHWFGTTQIGGDVFVQTMRGLQKSLSIGLLAAVVSTGLAAVVGAAAGYFGRWADRALMWLVDLMLVLPGFLILAIMSPWLRERGWFFFMLMLAAFMWMITARIVRGMTLTLREREFVKAARFMGESPWRIIFRHILPNMASLLIVDATINVGSAVLAETGLSYFGFGVQPPDVSLGTLIRDGAPFALTSPWLFLPAGLLLILGVLAVSFVGDGLRDALDPHASHGRFKEKKNA